jgi:hypothetical protein
MARIVIEPQPIEMGRNREVYEALAEDLREAGHDARLEYPPEQRGGIHHAAFDVQVFLLDRVSDAVITVIVGLIVERLTRSRRPRKERPPEAPEAMGARGATVGPRGEILREFDIPPPHSD